MKIITLGNNKGGVTKTTTTVNLGYGIAREERRVLIIDADAQSNSTYSLLGHLNQEPTLFDVLINGTKTADAIVPTSQENLFLVTSSINLSAADLPMSSAAGRARKLARVWPPIQ